MSRIVLTAASRVGCVRSNNEDMVLAYDKFVRSEAYHTEFMTENVDRFVIALADGMGGHNAGEVASADVLANLQFFLNDLPKGLSISEFNEVMVVWLDSVNKMINSKGHVNPSMSDMGTTLVAVLFYGAKYYWVNCGDSRLYRLRDGKLLQLSTDHSLNTLHGEKRHSNVITNCIGAGCKNSFIDMYEFTDDFLQGDTYMICSDGLNDMIHDEQIECLMQEGASANRLCEAAIEAGGYDNVSVCVFSVM
ncbi:MAG: serine/threonine-protein phosphatase [Paludibacteraceae bacterium]|nr:serine/threonine-protein phosphatase [Paludibacteraceae bacterium]MBQ8714579.1 serine/threonine-protein phosphatase [Prevotella sp.]